MILDTHKYQEINSKFIKIFEVPIKFFKLGKKIFFDFFIEWSIVINNNEPT